MESNAPPKGRRKLLSERSKERGRDDEVFFPYHGTLKTPLSFTDSCPNLFMVPAPRSIGAAGDVALWFLRNSCVDHQYLTLARESQDS